MIVKQTMSHAMDLPLADRLDIPQINGDSEGSHEMISMPILLMNFCDCRYGMRFLPRCSSSPDDKRFAIRPWKTCLVPSKEIANAEGPRVRIDERHFSTMGTTS